MNTLSINSNQIPECLNPFNPKHYILLLYWIFLRPTDLKNYLYKIDPDLYKANSNINKILSAFNYKSYRNLYIIAAIISFLFPLIFGCLLFTPLYFLNEKINLINLILTSTFGIIIGLIMCLLISCFGSFRLSIALRVAAGIAAGMIGSIAGGIAGEIVVCAGKDVSIFIAFQIAAISSISVSIGILLGVLGGVRKGILIGVTWGIVVGIAVGIIMTVTVNLHSGLVIGAIYISSSIRLPFYIIEFIIIVFLNPLKVFFYNKKNVTHPLEYDEYSIIPFPGSLEVCKKYFKKGDLQGLEFLSTLGSNPFQYWVIQASLLSHLAKHDKPIHFLYSLLEFSEADNLIVMPIERRGWQKTPNIRSLFLSEIANTRLRYFSDINLIYYLTYLTRQFKSTPLTELASMIFQLLSDNSFDGSSSSIFHFNQTYNNLDKYPGGQEISTSYSIFVDSLKCKDLLSISQVFAEKNPLPEEIKAVRPNVIIALKKLNFISNNVNLLQEIGNSYNELTGFVILNKGLQELKHFVDNNITAPEKKILHQVIEQWTEIIITASALISSRKIIEPIYNPYVTGNPVTGKIFVGREDIIRKIESLHKSKFPPSTVIYGHRRMGKSSILLNLQEKIDSETTVINFNMQVVGWVKNTGTLFYKLATRLYKSLEEENLKKLDLPIKKIFIDDPYDTFFLFLQEFNKYRNGQRFIIAIDEFEIIERQIKNQILEPEILEYCRGLLQTYSWLIFAFAGLHTLEEMTRDYWDPLFASVTPIPVSFLSHKAARRLITQPTEEFELYYDPEAIEEIINLTNGQPYLIQLICSNLVDLFNSENLTNDSKMSRCFSITDIDRILNDPQFNDNGDGYFSGVWGQAELTEPAGQQKIMQVLINGGLSINQISELTGLSKIEATKAINTLQSHDVVRQDDTQYIYCVELMRRWVAKRT